MKPLEAVVSAPDIADLMKLAGVRPYTPCEPWVWAFDLEFGRMVRGLSDEDRAHLVVGMAFGPRTHVSANMTESLLRLPQHLSGLSDEGMRAIAAVVAAARPATRGK